MHISPKFQQNDRTQLERLMRDYPFATLVTHSEAGLDANHLPVILVERDGKQWLHAHIARANPLWKTIADSAEVLVIFNGPNGYISPNHYPTKQATGKAVPTWNYMAVHARGRLTFVHDSDWLLAMVETLTAQHEAEQAVPWSTADAPASYIEKMLTAIVGLEIEITSVVGQWKLSQNQPEENRLGVVAGLAKAGGAHREIMAQLVEAQMDPQG